MNDFYGILLAHGHLSTRKKVKASTRCYYPNESTFARKKMIPVFTFGTTGLVTDVQKTIPCFMYFTQQFGTEFTNAVAAMLLRYGDSYLSRYRLPESPSVIDKAVAYMVNINRMEIGHIPQNRFFTFYREDQEPFDFTFYTNKKNEIFLSNSPYPTIDLKTKGGKRYYTINDFFENPLNLSTKEFQNQVTEFVVDRKNKPILTSFDFLNEVYVLPIDNSEKIDTISCLDYVFPFGICNIVNVFSVIQLGAYGTDYKEKGISALPMLDTFHWKNSQSAKLSLTEIINYFKNYRRNYSCKGIFTFSCKVAELDTFDNNAVLNYQHFERGTEIWSDQDKRALDQDEEWEKQLLKSKRLVQSRLGRK